MSSEDYTIGPVTPQAVISQSATVQGTVQGLRFRMQVLAEAARDVLKSGVDYGVIPGTGEKPTLLKPGAEKLATLFGLHPNPVLVDKIEDWEKGLFYYRYRCELSANDGTFVCAAEGSANSREKKYRWRYVPDFKATEDERASAVRTEQRTGKTGKPYAMLVLENSEPFDLVNTLQKMAQKRALVAAVLSGTGASEFYTQDIEDLDFGVVEAAAEPPSPPPAPAPPAPAPAAPAQPAQREQHAAPAQRPLGPEAMATALRRKAGWVKSGQHWIRPPDTEQKPPSNTQMARCAAVVGHALGAIGSTDEQQIADQRHAIFRLVWGRDSTKLLAAAEVQAMLDAWEDADKPYAPNAWAPEEVRGLLAAAAEKQASIAAALEADGAKDQHVSA